jgi:hypothetical protein
MWASATCLYLRSRLIRLRGKPVNQLEYRTTPQDGKSGSAGNHGADRQKYVWNDRERR